MVLYYQTKGSIDDGSKNYSSLGVICFICYSVGHIAIDCNQFNRTIKGNLKKYYKKIGFSNLSNDEDSNQISPRMHYVSEETSHHDTPFGYHNKKTRSKSYAKLKSKKYT